MKNIYLIITGLLFINYVVNAQYRVNKNLYDYHSYSSQPGDPYDPTVMGCASLVIPGLGQILSQEPVRGIGFLGGSLGLIAIKFAGLHLLDNNGNNRNIQRDYDFLKTSVGFAQLGIHVWSAIDAVRVAKVNNMVFRDMHKQSFNIQILPYYGCSDMNGMYKEVPVGLSFMITF